MREEDVPALIELAHAHLQRAVQAIEAAADALVVIDHGASPECLDELDSAIAILGAVDRSPSANATAYASLRACQAIREILSGPGVSRSDKLAQAGSLLGFIVNVVATRDGEESLQLVLAGIAVNKLAVVLTPPGHPDRLELLVLLSDLYSHVYSRTADVAVAERAVLATREQLVEMPVGHPERASHVRYLAQRILILFHATGDPNALAEGAEVAREAMALAPRDPVEQAETIMTLAQALRWSRIFGGDPSYSEERYRLYRQAVEIVPAEHPYRAMVLCELGKALMEQAEGEGSVELADEALQHLRAADEHLWRFAAEAADLLPPETLADVLATIGKALAIRYELTLDLRDLEEGITFLRQAVGSTDGWGTLRPDHLQHLSGSLYVLYRRRGRFSDLEESLRLARDAVAETLDLVNRPETLLNLSYRLRDLFNATGDLGALDESILASREALALTPPDRAVRAVYLHNLGACLRLRFARTEDVSSLTEAVSLLRAATVGPHTGLLRSQCLGELGLALPMLALYGEAFGGSRDQALLAEARTCLEQAIALESVPVWSRIRNHQALAVLAASVGDGPTALSAMDDVLELTELHAAESLVGADRNHRLTEAAEFAGIAATAGVVAGRPDRAVELLERARSVLAAETLRLRSGDLERLRADAPSLADEFEQARAALEAPEKARQARRDVDRISERIRLLPGHEGFRRPPRIAGLAPLARKGPVVIPVAGRSEATAFILTEGDGSGHVEAVPLPALDPITAGRQAQRLWHAGHSAYRDLSPMNHAHRLSPLSQDVHDVLAWLWEAVTEPVLSRLGITRPPQDGEPWPQVWWCPAGVLSYLPFHAAGRRGEPAVLDYVVSSYTTTVQALARSDEAETDDPSMLIVPVPDTPGAPLPGVDAEARALLKLVPDALALARPTRHRVLAALPGHGIAHFACHGHSDRTDPALSRLLLADHATEPLTLSDISSLNLKADLAYLSACDTAVAPVNLTDQSLHFTGAFQLAGYRHVIGTLWAVDDTVAAELATDFYERLTGHGAHPPRTGLSAFALHDAVRALRNRFADAPALWAAHTHTG